MQSNGFIPIIQTLELHLKNGQEVVPMTGKRFLLLVSAQSPTCKACKMWDSLTPRKSVPPKILIVSLLIHTDRTRIKRSLSLILVKCTNKKDTRKPVTSPNPSTPYLHLGLNHCGPTRGPRVQSSLESAGKEVQGMNAGQLHTSFHQRKDY